MVSMVRHLLGLDDVGPQQADDGDSGSGGEDEVSVAVPSDHPLASLVGTVDFVRSKGHVRAADLVEMLAPRHLVVMLPGHEGEAWLSAALLDAGVNVAAPVHYSELLAPLVRPQCTYSTWRTQGLGELLLRAGSLATG